mmetsp:Transcript_20137/g.55483  ORF Transcript_20137/g.55483 Transcript_20137/m.55483 type:complete len:208 (+) Transcript_20137:482-1105(+)
MLPWISPLPIGTTTLNLANHLSRLPLWHFRVNNIGKSVLQLRRNKIRSHLVDGLDRHKLSFLPLTLVSPLCKCVLIIHNRHTDSLSKVLEGCSLPLTCTLVHVRLVKNYVAWGLARNLHQLVENRSCLGDKLLPSVCVVSLASQIHNFHLIDNRVRTKQKVILSRVGLHVLLCPVCLSACWQASKHDKLTIFEAVRMLNWIHDNIFF